METTGITRIGIMDKQMETTVGFRGMKGYTGVCRVYKGMYRYLGVYRVEEFKQ